MIDTATAKNLVTGSIWRWRATPTGAPEELEEFEVREVWKLGYVSYIYDGYPNLFHMEILRFLEKACLVSLPGQEVPAADPKQDQALVTPAGSQLPKAGSQWRYNSSSETSKCHGAIFTVAKVVDDSIEGSSTCGCGGEWSSVDYFLKKHTPVVKPEKQAARPTCNAGCTPQTPCLSVECPARAENEISKSAWATRQHPNLIPASWLGSIMSDYIVPGGEPSARPEFATSGAGGLACDMGLRR